VEMHQVRYFLTLYQELNFTRAAEKCNVAQPALARAIKLLEDEFGGLLFHRERARTHRSEIGQAVRPYLEEVQRQSQQAKRLAGVCRQIARTRQNVERHTTYRYQPAA
jgi:DNA-binding transcriptional LysR family regulator